MLKKELTQKTKEFKILSTQLGYVWNRLRFFWSLGEKDLGEHEEKLSIKEWETLFEPARFKSETEVFKIWCLVDTLEKEMKDILQELEELEFEKLDQE